MIKIDNPDPKRWYRRAISFSVLWIIILLLPLGLLSLPLLMIIDLAIIGGASLLGSDKRSSLSRGFICCSRYVINENIGIFLCFIIWVEFKLKGQHDLFIQRNHKLQQWWCESLMNTLVRMFQLKFDIDGNIPDCGGKILFVRHTSSADTLLPLKTITIPQNLFTHYVLKTELCWDPCLDIVAHRLPNALVRRGQGESEIQRIISLSEALNDKSCIIIFPEGTRHTYNKRKRVIESLRKKNDHKALEVSEKLKHSLLPRKGGSLGLVARNPSTPIVFMAHLGFEKSQKISSLFNGELMRQSIQIRFWEEVPPERPDEYENWLYAKWMQMDLWIEQMIQAKDSRPLS